jgi:hypothetical protein
MGVDRRGAPEGEFFRRGNHGTAKRPLWRRWRGRRTEWRPIPPRVGARLARVGGGRDGGGAAGRAHAAHGGASRTRRRGRPVRGIVHRRAAGRLVHHPGEYECSGTILGEQAFQKRDHGAGVLAGEVRHDTHHQSLSTTRGDALGRRFESALQLVGGVKRDGVGHVGSIRRFDFPCYQPSAIWAQTESFAARFFPDDPAGGRRTLTPRDDLGRWWTARGQPGRVDGWRRRQLDRWPGNIARRLARLGLRQLDRRDGRGRRAGVDGAGGNADGLVAHRQSTRPEPNRLQSCRRSRAGPGRSTVGGRPPDPRRLGVSTH